MNPFVNPNKRSITLPGGCKDLMDVLRLSTATHDLRVGRFILLLLVQAQKDKATQVVIGAASPSPAAQTPVRCRYKDCQVWTDLPPFPSSVRSFVISEPAQMAGFSPGEYWGEGVLDLTFVGTRLVWRVSMTSDDAECVLTRLDQAW